MYLSEVYGQGGIYAKVVAASIANGTPIYTLETKAPKFIDAEFEKHRMLSSNSSSSRAIPFKPLAEVYLPFDIRKNQKGMQGYEKLEGEDLEKFQADVKSACDFMHEQLFSEYWDYPDWSKVVHKQHLNRYLEPWMFQKKVVTATEWSNFFNLRLAPDAQPEIQELARCMLAAMSQVKPVELEVGQWHIPYVPMSEWYDIPDDELIKCSVARCARVSYMNHDNTDPDIEKDLALYDMLLESKHLTPFEHVVSPMEITKITDFNDLKTLNKGISHVDREGSLWSGNLKGWYQYRKIIE
jgi:thymidylate synthase ThyX